MMTSFLSHLPHFWTPFPFSPPLHSSTELGLKVVPRLHECCRQSQAEVVSNSRNKIHQILEPHFSRALYSSARSPTQSVNSFLCRRSDDGLRAPIVVVVVILLPRAGSPPARARVCPQDIPSPRPSPHPRVPSLLFLPISLSAKGETRPRAARSPAITKWSALSECYPSATSTGSSKRKGAKLGEGSSVRANWLCIGFPKLVGRRKEANSNKGHLFCTSRYFSRSLARMAKLPPPSLQWHL